MLAVAEVVDIGVTDLHEEGDTLAGTLTLTRQKGDDPVTASRVERSVLIQVDAELPLELAGDEDDRIDAGGVRPGELRAARAVGDEEAVRVPAVGHRGRRRRGAGEPAAGPGGARPADRTGAAGLRPAGLTGRGAGPAAPGGTGQPGRGRDRRALARRADDSAAGWQAALPGHPTGA